MDISWAAQEPCQTGVALVYQFAGRCSTCSGDTQAIAPAAASAALAVRLPGAAGSDVTRCASSACIQVRVGGQHHALCQLGLRLYCLAFLHLGFCAFGCAQTAC